MCRKKTKILFRLVACVILLSLSLVFGCNGGSDSELPKPTRANDQPGDLNWNQGNWDESSWK